MILAADIIRNKIVFVPPTTEINHGEAYVYILLFKFRIVYIGFSQSLTNRLRDHHNNKSFDYVLAVKCNDSIDALFLEKDLIFCFNPTHNHESKGRFHTKLSKDALSKLRSDNLLRWNYYNENKHLPPEKSEMVVLKNRVLFSHQDLRRDYDITRLKKLKTI